ncbi:MAG TPA: dTMP kinase [Parachlamydiaceae bacterium]|nr:dTMP kinase [Parachlamydiaceae bacterium]
MRSINPRKPCFITIEGGEGAGKTTLINFFERNLQDWGFTVVKTREPGGTLLGNDIRNWLLNRHESIKIGAKAELLMFLAARAQHIEEVIVPAIAAGKIVICDRFNDSTIAYQGVGRGLGLAFVQDLCNDICGQTVPDLTFYLDVDPKIGLQRTKRTSKENARAGEVDRIEAEALEFHQRVRNAFAEIAQSEPERFISVDASQSQEIVTNTCKRLLAVRFGKESA